MTTKKAECREAVQPWPGPGEEPWWWEKCGETMRSAHVRARAWNSRLGQTLTAQEEAREEEKKAREEERRSRFPLYIRFGELPASGDSFRSYDWKKPTWEKGVSCFRGRRDEDGAYAVDTEARAGLLNMYKKLVGEERPVYLAHGREVDEGVCGEPVLKDVRLSPLPGGSRVRAVGYRGEGVSSLWGSILRGYVPVGSALEAPKEIFIGESRANGATPFLGSGLAASSDKSSLVDAVLSRSTYPAKYPVFGLFAGSHGEEHWKLVAVAGARLSRAVAHDGLDPLVVFLFSLFHDSARLGDTEDPWHGERGARLAREMLEGEISEKQLDLLADAVEEHDRGKVSRDLTVGTCWDADRLCLWRVGKKPDPRLLSTQAARNPEIIEWARGLQAKSFSWSEVVALYGDLGQSPAGEGPT